MFNAVSLNFYDFSLTDCNKTSRGSNSHSKLSWPDLYYVLFFLNYNIPFHASLFDNTAMNFVCDPTVCTVGAAGRGASIPGRSGNKLTIHTIV